MPWVERPAERRPDDGRISCRTQSAVGDFTAKTGRRVSVIALTLTPHRTAASS